MRAFRTVAGAVVDALQWTGSNLEEVRTALGAQFLEHDAAAQRLIINTGPTDPRPGTRVVEAGGYLVQDPAGGFHAADQGPFEETYTAVA